MQYEKINLHYQKEFNYDLYKEIFYVYFNFLEIYHDYFVVQKNKNYELQNIILIITTQLTKYFPKYNLLNTEIISLIDNYKSQRIALSSFYEQNYFIKNIKLYNNVFFYDNPYKASILFINIIMKNKNLNNVDSVNYYDLEKLLNNFIFFMENEVKEEICDNSDVLETKKH